MQWLTVECEQSLAPGCACARAFEKCLSQTPKALFALPQKIEFGVCKTREKFVITNFFVFVTLFASETREIFHFTKNVNYRHFNRPFYQNGGHIELILFKEYYRMPRGHEHISFVFSSAF